MSAVITDPDSKKESPWQWLRSGWTISLLVIALLVVGVYVEEDWRGALAWKQAQEEIAAAGESLDPNKFIPPAIPDEQNFGLLPIFAVEDGKAVGIERAFARADSGKLPYDKEIKDPGYFPYLGDWSKGESPDLPMIRKRLADICRDKLPTVSIPANATPTDMYELLAPVLAELRAADNVRPLCRFDRDYTTQPPFSRSFSGVVSLIKLARVLAYEEQLALISKQPARAVADLKVGWKTDAGLRQEPLLIPGLISIAVIAIQIGQVTNGLAAHAWNDAQLKEIDGDLGQIDFLSETQLCLRGEVASMTIPIIDLTKTRRSAIRDIITGGYPSGTPTSMEDFARDFISSTILLSIPNGWFDQVKASIARLVLLERIKSVDPQAHRVFPGIDLRVQREIPSPVFSIMGVFKDSTPSVVSHKRLVLFLFS